MKNAHVERANSSLTTLQPQPQAAPSLRQSQLALPLQRLRRNRGALTGLVILTVIVLASAFAPLLTPFDPSAITPQDRWLAPSPQHPFGTDNFGRDIFARVLHGGRVSLPMGLIAVVIAIALGLMGGLLAGYYGGWVDGIIMRCVDVMLAFPGLLLALVIIATLGPGLVTAMIAIGIASVPTFIRVVRAGVLSAREKEFVDAARALGVPDGHILVRHLLPNIVSPVIVLATLGVASAIISGAALSFLGLGAKPPTPEWGAMLSESRSYLRVAPWTTTFPGLAIVVTALAINLIGDGLRDALDPRMTI